MLQDTPSFLAYWRNVRSRTVRVLAALEPEDLDWAPRPGAFSFGDLFRHLAGVEQGVLAHTHGAECPIKRIRKVEESGGMEGSGEKKRQDPLSFSAFLSPSALLRL